MVCGQKAKDDAFRTGRKRTMHPRVPTIRPLYHDQAIAVVDKPSGLSVHRGQDPGPGFAMTQLRDLLGRWVFPVHRLDRATSGVLLFALSGELAGRLQEQFAAGRVEKRYLALVRGLPAEEGVIDHPVRRGGKVGERVPAVTDFRRLGSFERFALVEARPRTGRLHQIRRHFKHLSHPLVGDVRYGKGEINRMFRRRFDLHRLALHALELGFEHPVDGSEQRFLAPLGEDLAGPLVTMGLGDVLRQAGALADGGQVGGRLSSIS